MESSKNVNACLGCFIIIIIILSCIVAYRGCMTPDQIAPPQNNAGIENILAADDETVIDNSSVGNNRTIITLLFISAFILLLFGCAVTFFQANEINQRNKELSEENEKVKAESQGILAKVQSYLEKAKNPEQEIAKLNQEIEALRTNRDRLKQKSQQEINLILFQLQKTKSEYEKAQQTLQDAEITENKRQQILSTIESLERTIKLKNEEIQRISKNLDNIIKQEDFEKFRFEELNKIKTVQEDFEKFKLAELNKIKIVQEQKRELEKIISNLSAERERRVSDFQAAQIKLNEINAELNRKKSEYKRAEEVYREAQKFETQKDSIIDEIDDLKEQIKRLEQQKHDKANKLAISEQNQIFEIEKSIEKEKRKLQELETKIENAYKEYKYRKTLPESHEKLKQRYEELKAKFEEAKSAARDSALSSKERDKFLSQFDKLGRSYVDDTFRFIVSRMTPNNYTASRDRILKIIGTCRAFGFYWSEDMEEDYVEKLRDEFKRILRLEDARLEQQRIKEQIREEEKALREIEKLKKKEEEALLERAEEEKARDKMQQAINDALIRANGEHTAQIVEMEKALSARDKTIAEKDKIIEDSRRAISNAQITKSGHVYVLSNIGSFGDGVFKIGMTRRSDPQERVGELSGAAVPFPFDVHMMVSTANAPELEKRLHRKFNDKRINRVNLRKEFFRVDIDDVQDEIEKFLGKKVDYRADPHVLEELAEQYRQSQNITLEDIEEVETLFDQAGVNKEFDD